MDYKLSKSKMDATVSRLASGIRLLLKSNGIDLIGGEANIVSEKEVVVNDTTIKAENVVIDRTDYLLVAISWGPHSDEIIAEALLTIKMRLGSKDIFEIMRPHPTLAQSFAESVREIYTVSIDLPIKGQPRELIIIKPSAISLR